ncbi:MAG: hypothetical protein M1834_004448 [Cirrosporium novae-zelandiae]|nr:MAG: hypothetical protein M1834_004448 [Cirrosporium novae-zelandiae]
MASLRNLSALFHIPFSSLLMRAATNIDSACLFTNLSCINPTAKLTTEIAFPIFPTPPQLVYAIEAATIIFPSTSNTSDSIGSSSALKTSLYLTYDTYNITPGENLNFSIASLVVPFSPYFNTTGTGIPGGSSGGCSGLLGTTCSKSYTNYLKHMMSVAISSRLTGVDPLSWAVANLGEEYPFTGRNATSLSEELFLEDLGCLPNLVTSTYGGNSLEMLSGHIRAEDANYTGLIPSGSDEFTWFGRIMNDKVLDTFLDSVFVVVTASYPSVAEENYEDHIQVNLACMRWPWSGNSNTDTASRANYSTAANTVSTKVTVWRTEITASSIHLETSSIDTATPGTDQFHRRGISANFDRVNNAHRRDLRALQHANADRTVTTLDSRNGNI